MFDLVTECSAFYEPSYVIARAYQSEGLLTADTMDNITVKAYGKINIALDILGRRPDGYHEVSMIMQSVSLADELVFEKTAEPGITLMCMKSRYPGTVTPGTSSDINNQKRATLSSGDFDLTEEPMLPSGDTNIICKAYHALNAYLASRSCATDHQMSLHTPAGSVITPLGGVRCTLTKNIPIAAGMAGGSTDAAATLKALNELFSLGLSSQELADIAVKLGADVPYCLMGGTALSEGIGEKLTALPSLPECSIVLVHPHISVSTKEVYEAYDRVDHTFHPDITRIRQCIEAGDLEGVCAIVGNVLEEATIPMHPQISDIKKELASFNPLCTLMTGSGPTVFALFRDESKAKKASEHFKSHSDALDVYVVHPM